MMNILRLLAVMALIFAFSSPAAGQIYQYTDKKGNVVFSDSPPAGAEAKEKRLQDNVFWSSQRAEADVPVSGSDPATPQLPVQERKRDYGNVTVVMYMTKWCGYCKKAGAYVRSLGARLTEYDIDADQGRKEEMRKMSGGSLAVPLLNIDGTIIRGFNGSAIKAALDRNRAR
jgi:glutaredoxin